MTVQWKIKSDCCNVVIMNTKGQDKPMLISNKETLLIHVTNRDRTLPVAICDASLSSH